MCQKNKQVYFTAAHIKYKTQTEKGNASPIKTSALGDQEEKSQPIHVTKELIWGKSILIDYDKEEAKTVAE